ncbi:uncharacterized protein L3040_006866 [Drepanopeziza brunnea f. sp. 'multigermtubi']|uniref:2EXR domain-containing protein n=1 Tax=Marssonina brunnea f. sp. multigermtubi (strain MB_m1) TaxID=1072389 RepID=K1WKG4_MARBU|nr:uncharacterized protein MBM_08946 [Drepanopeziza brunnea f. sp. 'multigermtubi' MB_m1]EKD12717.1 hypothetical protein MBM_08946 [Drepanopeziza brunnea f. sp. 'multigermtubi' MB_m1]KAJ5037992.1 hypothetical protein L3040_006866 [Drepanopeziza brunnea f. sp. 'multigermtubi']
MPPLKSLQGLPIRSKQVIPSPPASSPAPKPPKFHKFSELPAEIRIKIWKFAIRPQLIQYEFDYKHGAPPLNIPKVKPGRISCTRSPRNLLATNHEARAIVKSLNPDSYEWIQEDDRLLMTKNPSTIPIPIFNPSLDTILLQGLHELGYFSWAYRIDNERLVQYQQRNRHIRSIAIHSFLEAASIVAGSHGTLYEADARACFGSESVLGELCYRDMERGFLSYYRLEELIIVYPGGEKSPDTEDMMPLLERAERLVVVGDAEETERRISTFLEMFSEQLLSSRRAFSYWHPVDGELEEVETSEWWKDAKITLMTEEELMRRFQ